MPDNLSPNAEPLTAISQTVDRDTVAQVANTRLGLLSIYTCPECGGSLWQIDTPVLIQFRCHIGHVLSGEDLLHEQAQAIEASLSRAFRLLEDHRNLARQLAPEARDRGLSDRADWLEGLAQWTVRQSQRLQQILESGASPSTANAGLDA